MTPTNLLRVAKAAGTRRVAQWGVWRYADDIQGEAILKATRAYMDHPGLSVSGVHTAADRGAIDYVRQVRGRNGTKPDEIPVDPVDMPDASTCDPITGCVDRIAVGQMLDCLPERERLVTETLMAADNQRDVLPVLERELGVGERQCYNLYRRAVRRMREML